MEYELKPGVNTGVRIGEIRPTDWRSGGESGAVKKVLEESGDFSTYLPDEEVQAKWDASGMLLIDTSACVTFSAMNAIETLMMRLRASGGMPSAHEAFLQAAGYVNKSTGKVNFSDRFTAKMSGTTKAGNYLEKVGDSMRNDGLLPEADWAWPDMSDLSGHENYDARFYRYYAVIPQELKDKAAEFVRHFRITYEWVLLGTTDAAKLQDALRYGPVQIAAAVCSPWSSTDGMPPIPGCGCGTQHATLVYGRRDDGAWRDFDHYKSFRKVLASDYCIQWGLQYFLEPIIETAAPTKPVAPSAGLKFGMGATAAVKQLQTCLQYVKAKDGTTFMRQGLFGIYGSATQAAVARFQVENGIADNPQGYNYGLKTRAALVAALARA